MSDKHFPRRKRSWSLAAAYVIVWTVTGGTCLMILVGMTVSIYAEAGFMGLAMLVASLVVTVAGWVVFCDMQDRDG